MLLNWVLNRRSRVSSTNDPIKNSPRAGSIFRGLAPSRTGVATHTDFLIRFWVANDMFLIFISLRGIFSVLHTKSVFLRYTRTVSKISIPEV